MVDAHARMAYRFNHMAFVRGQSGAECRIAPDPSSLPKPMKRSLTLAVVALALAINADAKRAAPKEVAPVTMDGIVYAAPLNPMGCVQAKNEKTGNVCWFKQIYVVKYDADLEKDVQDCFITNLRFEGDKLIVTNEDGGEFQLNPKTLTVKAVSGKEVIDRTAKKPR